GVFVGAAAFEGDAVALEDLAVDEVAGDFADEDVAAERFGIRGAAIDADPAAAGPIASTNQLAAGHVGLLECPSLGAEFAPGFGRADAIDAELIARFGTVVNKTGDDQVRIALHVCERQDDMLHGVADIAEEAVAPVVEAGPVALAAANRFDLFRDG